MSAAEGVDIDLYADDIEQDFNTDEFAAEGVDLYDDVITTTSGTRRDSEGGDPQSSNDRPTTPNNVSSPIQSKINSSSGNTDHFKGDREYIQPLRKHQVYIGNLTWWTSDRDIQESLNDIGVHDFIEVKFYENRANGQSKGYCVLTVGSDASLKIIKDKFSKKEIHGQVPVVTPPTKQALNQFEAQSKTRPTPGPGGSNNSSGGGPSGGGGGGNMNNMMSGPGPRGPMGGPQMGYGMNRMGSPIRPPRGMGPPPGHRHPGSSHQGSPGGQGQYSQRMGPPGMQGPGGPHQSNHQGHSMPPGPPQRFPPPFQGGPPRGPPHQMPPHGHGMDHQRGPPPRQDWNRPPMNPYPPQGPPGPIPPPGPPMPGPPPQVRGLPPQGIMTGPPPPAPGAPAPHMNPAFFNPQGPSGPPQGPPPAAYNNSPRTQPGPGPPQYPPVEHHETSAMSEAEFEEIMGRNRTVSRSAISRAVTDAASGEFASAIETLVTAISLIKQSKVAQDDRCKILISSLQDTLHGIEAKSYGRRERSRSRERDRHRRRRDRSRSRERERDYRDRSRERERYYEYGDRSRERSRSREREYRERAAGSAREESTGSSRYYDERYRERERSERDRPQLRPPSERETRSRRSIPEGGPDQERSKYS